MHRIQPFDQVATLINEVHKQGYDSINVDLIYGLPLQTLETFNQTIEQVISLKADRIALYAYAHLPERFKSQRRIHENDIPTAKIKFRCCVWQSKNFLKPVMSM